jgi:hypothetical protein
MCFCILFFACVSFEMCNVILWVKDVWHMLSAIGKSFTMHLMCLMTSWAVVYDVCYLEPLDSASPVRHWFPHSCHSPLASKPNRQNLNHLPYPLWCCCNTPMRLQFIFLFVMCKSLEGPLMCMQSPSKCMQTNTSLDLARACCQMFVDEAKHIVDLMNVHWFKQSNGYKCFNTYFYFDIDFFHSCSLMQITIHLFLPNTKFLFFSLWISLLLNSHSTFELVMIIIHIQQFTHIKMFIVNKI